MNPKVSWSNHREGTGYGGGFVCACGRCGGDVVGWWGRRGSGVEGFIIIVERYSCQGKMIVLDGIKSGVPRFEW